MRLAALWLLLALPGAAAAQQGAVAVPPAAAIRIGYVDMKRLIDSAPQMVEARARLEREFGARDREFGAEQARLAEMDARLRDGADTLPAAELDTLRRQADALRRSIDRTRTRLREELAQRSEQEITQLEARVANAVSALAREEGYDLIVPSPVIYASGRIDITDRVLDRLKRDYTAPGTRP